MTTPIIGGELGELKRIALAARAETLALRKAITAMQARIDSQGGTFGTEFFVAGQMNVQNLDSNMTVTAGKLIDDAGLKGLRRGTAVVSPKHANFVVNEGGARARDVLEILDVVRETIARRTGVELELEVRVWRPRERSAA